MITVYTKNVCPYCVKAKNYLESKGIEYETINIEENQTERNWLMEQGYRSVPQMFTQFSESRLSSFHNTDFCIRNLMFRSKFRNPGV